MLARRAANVSRVPLTSVMVDDVSVERVGSVNGLGAWSETKWVGLLSGQTRVFNPNLDAGWSQLESRSGLIITRSESNDLFKGSNERGERSTSGRRRLQVVPI